jgi:hypothetical protein
MHSFHKSDKMFYITITEVGVCGHTYVLEVESDDSICEVSQKLSNQIDMQGPRICTHCYPPGKPHPRRRRFIFGTHGFQKVLDTCMNPPCKGTCRRLSNYGVGKDSTLQLIMWLRGWDGGALSYMVSVQGSSISLSELLLAILYLRTLSPLLILYSG